MAQTFLLEIGLEEMPAHVVTPAIEQLVAKTTTYLQEQRLAFAHITPYATPRRLAIEISGLADKQTDISESVKGPAKKIALDADGHWSKAAIGFTRGQGLTPEDITFKTLKGTDYVFVDKFTPGQPAATVLAGLDEVIKSMTFPTMMKWGAHHFEFVRPIRWLVALLGEQVIPFSILDVTTDRLTYGHRFLGHEIELATAGDYAAALTKEFVIADQAMRKQQIVTQIQQIAHDHDWTVAIDDDLLEEVTNLVEWPTAFAGNFDNRYLSIPDDVLITSMRDHQRFFYARDAQGALLPHFISVRNGTDHDLQNVIAGNEKVLTARLEDAMFFYTEDQKKTIAENVARLKTVSFHDKISTMAEKMARVTAIVDVLGPQWGLSGQALTDVHRASEIDKFDLVTGMVGEFAELQGVMGEKYALLQGETPAVAQAIREHYQPIAAEGGLPASTVGAVLAVADKIDSIMTFFAAGMIPSGSNDPYALRRQAAGILRITQARHWSFDVVSLLDQFVTAEETAGVAPALDQRAQVTSIVDFFKDRVRQSLLSDHVAHDIVDAVTNGLTTDITQMMTAAQLLQDHHTDSEFKAVIEALTRVMRLADKAPTALPDVDSSLFENEAEQALQAQIEQLPSAAANGLSALYQALATMQPTIAAYFEATMVMVDNVAVRENRLASLQSLAGWAWQLGDLNQLVVK